MHNIYMNQPGQTAPAQYQAMPGPTTGEEVHKKKDQLKRQEIYQLWSSGVTISDMI